MPRFSPPTVDDVPAVLPDTRGPARELWKWHTGHARGRTLLKENGVFVLVDNPEDSRVAAAQRAYLGGHVYEVTVDEVAELSQAGYGSGVFE